MCGIIFPTALSYHQVWQVLTFKRKLHCLHFYAMMLRFYFLLLRAPVSAGIYPCLGALLALYIHAPDCTARSYLPCTCRVTNKLDWIELNWNLRRRPYNTLWCVFSNTNVQGGAIKTGPPSHCKYSEIPRPNCVEIGERLQYYMLNTVINILFKNFITLWRHLAKTQLLSFIHIVQIDTVPVFSLGGATAR